MSLEQLSYAAQIAGSIGVMASLVYVGLQLHQNTAQLRRNEHNTTMQEWSNIRLTLVHHRDVAELWTAGLSGQRAMDDADRHRVEQFLAEHFWAAHHIWDRARRGVLGKGTEAETEAFRLTAAPLLAPLLATSFGRVWWGAAKVAFYPEFAAEVDRVLPPPAPPA